MHRFEQEWLQKIHKEINRQAALIKGKAPHRVKLEDMFNRFDKDGAGEMDLNELDEGLKSFG